ncbi:hypothetical protein ACFXOM_33810 [Streptomyces sp. NPDC059169]|uniref:hypothetical protein n=1 Tax=Streptomyces sp. NPDC059169 TaxID=3346754 RepID=UPI00367B33EF
MRPDSRPIRITRGQGGEVEVDGAFDAFAADVLRRAGFLFEPSLRGHWIRLPFDLGEAWENEHATWAAEMLSAARYRVDLDPSLRTPTTNAPPAANRLTRTAMTAQAPPPPAPRRPRS